MVVSIHWSATTTVPNTLRTRLRLRVQGRGGREHTRTDLYDPVLESVLGSLRLKKTDSRTIRVPLEAPCHGSSQTRNGCGHVVIQLTSDQPRALILGEDGKEPTNIRRCSDDLNRGGSNQKIKRITPRRPNLALRGATLGHTQNHRSPLRGRKR